LTSNTPTRSGLATGAGFALPMGTTTVMISVASRVAPSLSR
jgi:hypothetical protein